MYAEHFALLPQILIKNKITTETEIKLNYIYIRVFAGMYTFRPQGSDPHLKEFLFQFQTFFL